MSVIKVFPPRAWTIIIVYIIISIGCLYSNLNGILKKIAIIFTLFIVCISIYKLKDACNDIYETKLQWDERIKIIENEKEKGNDVVYLEEIIPKTKWNAQYGLLDIQEDNTKSPNIRMATYFNLKCINKKE